MTATAPFRGGLQVGNTLYAGYNGQLYTLNSDGEITLLTTLASTDNIFIARNNAATTNIAFLYNSGTALYLNVGSTALTTFTGLTGTPSALWSHLGYLMYGYGNGDIWSSDLNGTTFNSLNKARTESNPDGVVNGFSYNGQMYVMGEKTVEVWGDPTNASGFPLTRIGFNILPGLKAAHAVTGWQEEFGNPPIWVGSDNTVRQLNGYAAEKISPPDLDRLIADVVFPDTQLEAVCYIAAGHAFWQLNGPDWSWVFNLNNKTWHERKSHLSDKSRFHRSVFAFDKSLVGDTNSSDLWRLDYTLTEEAGSPLTAIMESGPVKDFPNRQRIRRADFDFTPGVGLASSSDIESDPTALIEVSKDGGKTWPLSYVRHLGKIGETQQRIFVLNAGLSGDEGARWRWSISDPVHVGFVGGTMETEVETK